MLPEKDESGAGEKVLEESRRRAQEKGHPIMDSPCGAVGGGGRDGHKTRRGKESPDLAGLMEEVRGDANRNAAHGVSNRPWKVLLQGLQRFLWLEIRLRE